MDCCDDFSVALELGKLRWGLGVLMPGCHLGRAPGVIGVDGEVAERAGGWEGEDDTLTSGLEVSMLVDNESQGGVLVGVLVHLEDVVAFVLVRGECDLVCGCHAWMDVKG